jgi:hypothetical protein
MDILSDLVAVAIFVIFFAVSYGLIKVVERI